MINLRNVPIQRKLRFVILATCTAALCVALSALFAFQYFYFQRDYKRDLESVAEIISSIAGPAISLGAADNTRTFLKALHAKPHITGAFILLQDGIIASSFGPAEEKLKGQIPAGDGFHSVGGDLVYVHPIFAEKQRLGTLYLLSDYRTRSLHLHGLYACILVAVLASSFLIAIVVSSRLERLISGPIQKLADTARRIAFKSDYSLRVEKEADDEIGEFTDTFNGMLSQIQQRDNALRHEIAERRRVEEEVVRVHQQLVDASRAAGMAEVATGVLHNVGNVLNSVNVSATLISERFKNPRTANLARAAQLLRERNGSLATFLTEDDKGRLLPDYLAEATEQLARDCEEAVTELDLLAKNIDHIKDIVAMQQTYARVSDIVESIPLDSLIEEAVRMNSDAFQRHHITTTRAYSKVPPAAVDKHKVLQILVNLLRNAKDAIEERDAGERKVILRLRNERDNMVAIEVTDTGVGIAPENLTRIFSHGFTTRTEGHGFGLHSAAIAAKGMGGSLTASSPGPSRGATFTLLLPAASSSPPPTPAVAAALPFAPA
jgi:signal transduction histidine kinase